MAGKKNEKSRAEEIEREVRHGRHYRAYKLLLRPDRFQTAQGFADYWKLASGIAADLGIETEAGAGYSGHEQRAVSFWDTPTFDLYRIGFILRRRRRVIDGFPAKEVEHTLKIRHPALETVCGADMKANTSSKCVVKFKEAILQSPESPQGMKSVFSHNGVLKLKTLDLVSTIGELNGLFPVTQMAELPPQTPIRRVNDLLIEEVAADLGQMAFDRFIASADVSVWRNRGTGEALAGEFSWQSRFKEELTSGKRRVGQDKSTEFYQALMRETGDWLLRGTTKTRAVYEYGGRNVECQE